MVDRDPAALESTARILRSAGYQLLEATTGSAALEAAPRADLVVLDLDLPDIDGFEVCRRIRTSPRLAELPVLHLSASFARAQDRIEALNPENESCLTRPVEAPVLIATVRALLFAGAQRQTGRAREGLLSSERAARAAAERSNRAKDEFLAAVSHELRNPLNAILGWATLLNRKTGLPEVVAQGLKAIERSSRVQAQMISDLQDYAGIAFGKVRLVRETVDPYPIVRTTIESVGGAAQAAGVELRVFYGEEVVRIDADSARLQQIVANLISNAVKFSSKAAAVEITARRHGDAFRLMVRDYGEGIEPEFLPRIFERFSGNDATATHSRGGLSLGMALVKQLTDAHGGSIRAESGGKGHGATFTLDLPLSRNDAQSSLGDA